MSVGGVPPTGGGYVPPSGGYGDDFTRALAQLRAANEQLQLAATLLEVRPLADAGDQSVRGAARSLAGCMLRIAANAVSGPEALSLSQPVLDLATSSDATSAQASVGTIRGAVAAIRTPVDDATEFAMMSAEIASERLLVWDLVAWTDLGTH